MGVSTRRFLLESGMFFFSRTPEKALADFDALALLATGDQAPSRAKLQLAQVKGAAMPHAVALIYPAEFDAEWSAWLTSTGYRGGESCDGGTSHVAAWYSDANVMNSVQVLGVLDHAVRPLEDLLATVGKPLQRKAG